MMLSLAAVTLGQRRHDRNADLNPPDEKVSRLMPTYVCWAARGRLTAEHKKSIAVGITTIHSECTGAPPAFVQTIFADVDADSHFIGGEDASDTVWVYGHIREHREEQVRTAISQQISQLLVDIVGIDATSTWTYINPLVNTDMVEFGHTLPLPGEEAQWIQDKPAPLRDRLLMLNELRGPAGS